VPGTVDDNLNTALQVHDMPVETFAALALAMGIPRASKAKIYESFRGGKALDAETAERLWKLWSRVEDLVHRAEPFPVSLRNATLIKNLLDAISRDGAEPRVEFLPFNDGSK
jgi:hypothetical protein